MYIASGNGFAVPVSTRKMSISETSQKRSSVRIHCKRCERCGTELKSVFVHGHEQCVSCGQVVYDCCQGEVSCEQQK